MLQFRDMTQFKSTVDSIIEDNSSIIQLKSDVEILKSDVQILKSDVQTLKEDVREIRVTFDQMQTAIQQMVDGINYLLKRADEVDYHSRKIEILTQKSDTVTTGLKVHVGNKNIHLAEN